MMQVSLLARVVTEMVTSKCWPLCLDVTSSDSIASSETGPSLPNSPMVPLFHPPPSEASRSTMMHKRLRGWLRTQLATQNILRNVNHVTLVVGHVTDETLFCIVISPQNFYGRTNEIGCEMMTRNMHESRLTANRIHLEARPVNTFRTRSRASPCWSNRVDKHRLVDPRDGPSDVHESILFRHMVSPFLFLTPSVKRYILPLEVEVLYSVVELRLPPFLQDETRAPRSPPHQYSRIDAVVAEVISIA